MVEHRIPNPGVAGSSPPVPATFIISKATLISFIYNQCTFRKVFMNLGLHIRNARAELTKVIFPTKGQVKQAYISVIIVVTVISLFLALVDLLMSSFMSAVLG